MEGGRELFCGMVTGFMAGAHSSHWLPTGAPLQAPWGESFPCPPGQAQPVAAESGGWQRREASAPEHSLPRWNVLSQGLMARLVPRGKLMGHFLPSLRHPGRCQRGHGDSRLQEDSLAGAE